MFKIAKLGLGSVLFVEDENVFSEHHFCFVPPEWYYQLYHDRKWSLLLFLQYLLSLNVSFCFIKL